MIINILKQIEILRHNVLQRYKKYDYQYKMIRYFFIRK